MTAAALFLTTGGLVLALLLYGLWRTSYNAGWRQGYRAGKAAGHEAGYLSGQDYGYRKGLDVGATDARIARLLRWPGESRP